MCLIVCVCGVVTGWRPSSESRDGLLSGLCGSGAGVGSWWWRPGATSGRTVRCLPQAPGPGPSPRFSPLLCKARPTPSRLGSRPPQASVTLGSALPSSAGPSPSAMVLVRSQPLVGACDPPAGPPGTGGPRGSRQAAHGPEEPPRCPGSGLGEPPCPSVPGDRGLAQAPGHSAAPGPEGQTGATFHPFKGQPGWSSPTSRQRRPRPAPRVPRCPGPGSGWPSRSLPARDARLPPTQPHKHLAT